MLDFRKNKINEWKHRYNTSTCEYFFTEINLCVCSAAELPNVFF